MTMTLATGATKLLVATLLFNGAAAMQIAKEHDDVTQSDVATAQEPKVMIVKKELPRLFRIKGKYVEIKTHEYFNPAGGSQTRTNTQYVYRSRYIRYTNDEREGPALQCYESKWGGRWSPDEIRTTIKLDEIEKLLKKGNDYRIKMKADHLLRHSNPFKTDVYKIRVGAQVEVKQLNHQDYQSLVDEHAIVKGEEGGRWVVKFVKHQPALLTDPNKKNAIKTKGENLSVLPTYNEWHLEYTIKKGRNGDALVAWLCDTLKEEQVDPSVKSAVQPMRIARRMLESERRYRRLLERLQGF